METRRIRATVSKCVRLPQYPIDSVNSTQALLYTYTHHAMSKNKQTHSPRLKSEHLEQIYLPTAPFLINGISSYRNLQGSNCNGVIRSNNNNKRQRLVDRRVVDVSVIETTATATILVILVLGKEVFCQHLTIQKRLQSMNRAHQLSNGASQKQQQEMFYQEVQLKPQHQDE